MADGTLALGFLGCACALLGLIYLGGLLWWHRRKRLSRTVWGMALALPLVAGIAFGWWAKSIDWDAPQVTVNVEEEGLFESQ